MISQAPTARVVIVEDQVPMRNEIEHLVNQREGFIVTGSCGSVEEAIDIIQTNLPDIVLLDINLSGGTGFDILDKLHHLSFKVIFLTAHFEHAIKAIKADAVDYLLKPVVPKELIAALEKARRMTPLSLEHLKIAYEHLIKPDDAHSIVVRSIDYWERIALNDILFCQSTDSYTTFHLQGGKKVLSSKHLAEYEKQLPTSGFLRPHQSYIVNTRYILRYRTDGFLILVDGTEIPVAMRRRDIVNEFFNNFK
jgi:two-component system LytT family response regulator